MRPSHRHTFFFHLLGNLIKVFFVLLFGFLVVCFILALFGIGNFAWSLIGIALPMFFRSALTIVACFAINAFLEAI